MADFNWFLAKGGYVAPVKLSADLADIVGGDNMPRHEVWSKKV